MFLCIISISIFGSLNQTGCVSTSMQTKERKIHQTSQYGLPGIIIYSFCIGRRLHNTCPSMASPSPIKRDISTSHTWLLQPDVCCLSTLCKIFTCDCEACPLLKGPLTFCKTFCSCSSADGKFTTAATIGGYPA